MSDLAAQERIENKIFLLRGHRVMIDRICGTIWCRNKISK